MGYAQRLFRGTEELNRQAILAALACRSGGSLLDLGPGDGAFTVRLAEHLKAERIAALELIEEQAELSRDRGIEVTVGDTDEGFPFSDGEFDLVHANQVIVHVRRTDRFLAEIRRVLAPDGLACISTNNLSSWHNVLSLALGFQPMPMHVSDEVIVGNPLNPEHGHLHRDLGRT